MKNAALYTRVSTKHQTTNNQVLDLCEYANRRGLTFQIYRDYASGSKERRTDLDRLMRDARSKLFDVVIVTRFDRFARSTRHLVEALEEFQALGIDFVSLNESIDTSTPMGKMVFTVLGAVAELERNIIRERVRSGIARAKANGTKFGRPKRIVDREKVDRLFHEGQTLSQIAGRAGISRRTVRRILEALAATSPPVGKSPSLTFAHPDSFQRELAEIILKGKTI